MLVEQRRAQHDARVFGVDVANVQNSEVWAAVDNQRQPVGKRRIAVGDQAADKLWTEAPIKRHSDVDVCNERVKRRVYSAEYEVVDTVFRI